MDISDFFQENPQAAIAFSGGVDSAFLLYCAARYGNRVRAYYVQTAFQPEFERRDARQLAQQLGVGLTVLEEDVLDDGQILENSPRRCYYCKRRLFRRLTEAARADGFSLVLDGTNASDDLSDRPGVQALMELGVRSPLRECGLTKQEIRRRSQEAGLFTFDKPAYACLATRIPTGEPITEEKLDRTQWAEDYLYSLGLRDFRVRLWQDTARIQLREADLPLAAAHREAIVTQLKRRYRGVVLDLEVRHAL